MLEAGVSVVISEQKTKMCKKSEICNVTVLRLLEILSHYKYNRNYFTKYIKILSKDKRRKVFLYCSEACDDHSSLKTVPPSPVCAGEFLVDGCFPGYNGTCNGLAQKNHYTVN